MTPFGIFIRELRARKSISLKKMAHDLNVSSAYLSALEHGHRGRPASGMIMQICTYFELIWDDAEHLKTLANLSHPKVTIDTSGLSPKATELANILSVNIGNLDDDTIEWIINEIKGCLGVAALKYRSHLSVKSKETF